MTITADYLLAADVEPDTPIFTEVLADLLASIAEDDTEDPS